jgi:hypothetical protein
MCLSRDIIVSACRTVSRVDELNTVDDCHCASCLLVMKTGVRQFDAKEQNEDSGRLEKGAARCAGSDEMLYRVLQAA